MCGSIHRDDDDSDGADEAGGGGDEEEAVAGAVGELRPEDGDETDSSEDERPSRNTSEHRWLGSTRSHTCCGLSAGAEMCCCAAAVGNVPLKWYKHEDHIGYDREGGKLIKKKQRDKLEEHMARQVIPLTF
jgi:ribosome biogenesis protein ERB1